MNWKRDTKDLHGVRGLIVWILGNKMMNVIRWIKLYLLTWLAVAGIALIIGIQGQAAELYSDAGRATGDATGASSAGGEEFRIRLVFEGKSVLIRMHDNPTSRDLLSRLPLTLKFSDYAGTEKIAYPSEKLSTRDAPSGHDPSVGDVTYYAPWGNLAIFYRDFRYSRGLIPLGVVESGLQELEELHGETSVLIEKAGNR